MSALKHKQIRKRVRRPLLPPVREEEQQNSENFLDELKSVDSARKEKAIIFLANVVFVPKQVNNEVLRLLIEVLYLHDNVLIHSCLCALRNLCELETTFVAEVFNMGLHNALLQLKSDNQQLLEPVLLLLAAVHDSLPEKYRKVIADIASCLTVAQLRSPNARIVLQFLFRTGQTMLPEDHYGAIYELFSTSNNIRTRSLAIGVLLSNEALRKQQTLLDKLVEYIQELVTLLDLGEDYRCNVKTERKNCEEGDTELMAEQVEICMEKDVELPVQSNANYEVLVNEVEAVEVILEALLTLLQDDWEDEAEQLEDEGNEENIHNSPENSVSRRIQSEPDRVDESAIRKMIVDYFCKRPQGLVRNSCLPFIQGLSLMELSLRLLSQLPLANTQANDRLASIAVDAMQNLVRLQPPQEILSNNISVGLHVLSLCQPTTLAQGYLIELGESVLPIKIIFQDCWLSLLDLYGQQFHPEKRPVTKEQNRRIAGILRRQIVEIPHSELEEWRGQAIDTLFDVFANEDFDDCFVELGFGQLLEYLQQQCISQKTKSKFVRLVVADIKRFLDYKRQMIKS